MELVHSVPGQTTQQQCKAKARILSFSPVYLQPYRSLDYLDCIQTKDTHTRR